MNSDPCWISACEGLTGKPAPDIYINLYYLTLSITPGRFTANMNDILFSQSILLAYFSVNQARDLLVAVIAIGLGLNIVYAVMSGNGRCFELASVRTLERGLGTTGARLTLIGIGSICVFLGAFLVAKSTDRKTFSNSVDATEVSVRGTAR